MTEKTKLSGRPDKTVTWIWLENAQLQVEYYDFSESAQRLFDNDIAYTITVNQMDKLYAMVNQNEPSLIAWMEQCFKSYFGIKKWLEKSRIDFSVQVEDWA